MLSFPSATARPTAVEVKLLLSEYSTCGFSADSGFHQPSATTCPCRTSMKLCIVSTALSAASTNARIAADETPCASGELRGNGVAAIDRLSAASSAVMLMIMEVFMGCGRCL